jgi:hypothetical protein
MKIISTPEFWYFLIGLIACFVIYYMGKSVKNEKNHLLTLFKANQTLSKELQTNLKTFISEFNADNKIAFHDGNVTYKEYLEMVITEYSNNLCDEKYELIRRQKLTKPNLESMIASLDQQNEALRLISLDMKRIMKQAEIRQ